ncbi:MAG: hypothetical protein M1816_004795 [Peltula sp. TS41687]|nr:MAG: hypothetical protein M1816_004795 [Peltula sp. TS41687]
MQSTRSCILYTALLWISIVQAVPSAKVPSGEHDGGRRHTINNQLLDVLQIGASFGTGYLLSNYVKTQQEEKPPRTPIHEGRPASRPHFKKAGDLANHLESTEDWHSTMDCIDSKLYAQTNGPQGVQLRKDYDDYFHDPKLLSDVQRQAITEIIWDCLDQVNLQAVERAKSRAGQEHAPTVSKDGALGAGNAQERAPQKPAKVGTGNEPAPRTGSRRGSRGKSPKLTQKGPQVRPGFRTLRDVKALLDDGDADNEDKNKDDKYFQALHCINLKFLERNNHNKHKANQEFLAYFYERGRLTPAEKSVTSDLIWSCVTEVKKANSVGVRWRPLVVEKKHPPEKKKEGDNFLMRFATSAGKILRAVDKGNPTGGMISGKLPTVARPMIIP